ncbi:glycoside hydrolase family 13 protein [Actinotalea sp. BY-33]|uniref:Glycoside hydrolase family 13 protein n=1 Tax=Actinotalea soli TaxID=2819234 RepID=A0A939LN23_9CELL|nr:glycoside hydrolase family 13 protein [Actinotalea soli]MBO1750676.1 glycoside hydrolase family 13 protein [Actinotalea soli]
MAGRHEAEPEPGAHLLDLPHHDGSALHVAPGPYALGDRVRVRVRVPAAAGVTAVHLRVVHDGEPRVGPMAREEPPAAGQPPSEAWYVGEVEVHNPVTTYRFLLQTADGHAWLTGRGVHLRHVPDAADFRLTVHAPAPSWARHAVVYQVFPDRFARAGRGPAEHAEVPAWAEPAQWSDEPVGSGPSTPRQLYGGDLAGIEERLDHLATLGVDVLYLTPFFPARSNHRYDASSFDHVDPVLGGDHALASLSAAVHARGMRIMGDLTTNHTGDAHEWFRRAQQDPSSPEARFYLAQEAPPGYVSWLGHASLPKLDHRDPELARRLVDGPGSVIARWLAPPFALDGWRIDVANMTGRHRDVDVTHQVARTIRATMQAANPEALLVSEHFHDASADLLGDGWHANMNYDGFSRPVWSWLADPRSTLPAHGLPVPQVRRTGQDMVATMRDFDSALPWAVTSHQWNLLGSHDTPRLRTVVGDPRLVEVAVGLLMTYPGTPMVFAGDEVGATGRNGEHARTTMPWDEPERWDGATFELYRRLITVRRSSPALREGGLRWAVVAEDAVAYLRETPQERVLVLASRAPWRGAVLPRGLLPRHLPAGTAQTLHGPDLLVDEAGLHLPAEGPVLGVWRLTGP